MIEAGIADGDTVIIKKVSNVDNGQIAVVLICLLYTSPSPRDPT